MDEVVHQLREAEAKDGKRVLTVRCGATFPGRTSDPQPAQMSVWGSMVTCVDCKA